MLLMLLATAFTMNIGFTLLPACPATLTVRVPETVSVGDNVTAIFDTDIPSQVDYSVVGEDGNALQKYKPVTGEAIIKITSNMLHQHVTVFAWTTARDCEPLLRNATFDVEDATQAFQLPPTITVIPWIIVVVATTIAGVLVWKR